MSSPLAEEMAREKLKERNGGERLGGCHDTSRKFRPRSRVTSLTDGAEYIGRGMMEEIEEMVCSPPEGGVFSSTAVLFGPEPLLLARPTDTEYAVSSFRPVTSPLWREEEGRIPRDWHEECQDSQLWCHCSPPSPYHSPVPLSPPRLSHTHSPVQVH